MLKLNSESILFVDASELDRAISYFYNTNNYSTYVENVANTSSGFLRVEIEELTEESDYPNNEDFDGDPESFPSIQEIMQDLANFEEISVGIYMIDLEA